ncbi:hypothetical protein B0H11DRAFT_395259 [Mycena galericulata]|nr:hypothetical protein B0H11DRAFT_395259 [Mycena galericulata]
MLPVIYRCLDPKQIPTLNPAAPAARVFQAAHALQTLPKIIVPAGVGPDLWPRIWAWFQFLDQYRPNITGMKFTVLLCGARFRREERSVLMNATDGFYTTVARVWAAQLHETNIRLKSLVFVLAFLKTVDVSNLQQLVEGAGGSFEDLAALVNRQIDLTTGNKDTPITQLHLDLLQDVLVFLTRVVDAIDDGDNPPNITRCLFGTFVVEGFFKCLIVTMVKLSWTTDVDPASTIVRCFAFLGALFDHRNMLAVLPAAVASGLIGCIVLCGSLPSLSQTHNHLMSLLVRHLTGSTVYAGVLLVIKSELARAAELLAAATPGFENSAVFKSWNFFTRTVEERFQVLDSILMTPRRTCDNIACNKMEMKTAFRMCSGCKHFYYCSKECQTADWSAGRHRAACSAYRTHSLSAHHHLTLLDRAFMRALLDDVYVRSKGKIYDQMIKCMKTHPNAGYFIVFDYVSDGPFTFSVHSLAEESSVLETLRKAGREWEDTVARAERSQGRLAIHVMRVRDGGTGRYWVIPLRSRTGRTHERLKHIAAELPSPVDGGDRPDYFAHIDRTQVQDRLEHIKTQLESLPEEDVPEYLNCASLDDLPYHLWDCESFH